MQGLSRWFEVGLVTNPNRSPRFRVSTTILVLSALLWIVLAKLVVPPLIERAYRGESLTIFNNMISGQAVHPVEVYLREWKRIAWNVTFLMVMSGLILALVTRLSVTPPRAAGQNAATAATPSRHVAILAVPAAAVAGALLIWTATGRFGPALSTDSVNYLAAAMSLAEGRGFRLFTGEPLVEFPPLYPALLAAALPFGADPPSWARVLNALAFAGLIVLTWVWLSWHCRSWISKATGIALVVLGPPLMDVFTYVWTEGIFIAFAVAALMALDRHYADGDTRSLAIAAIAVGLASATRYAAVPLILTALAVVWFRHPWPRRLRAAVIFLSPVVAFAAPWLARNYMLSGTLTGLRSVSAESLAAIVRRAVDVFLGWLAPGWPLRTQLALAILVAGALAAGAMTSRRNHGAIMAIGYAAVHTLWMIASLAFVAVEPLNSRYLSPAFVPAVVGGMILLDGLFARVSPGWRSSARLAVAGAVAAVLANLALHAGHDVHRKLRHGAGGFSSNEWRSSDLVRRLSAERWREPVLSNAPEVVFLATRQTARWGPIRHPYRSPKSPGDDLLRFGEWLEERNGAHLVWFDRMRVSHMFDLQDLGAVAEIEPVVVAGDGTIYLVKSRDSGQ
jgi:hypothetical protein